MPKRQEIGNHCSVDVIHPSPQVVPPSFVYTKSNYSSKFIAANFLSLKSELNFTSIKIFSEAYIDSRINVIPSPGAKISAKVDKNQQKRRQKTRQETRLKSRQHIRQNLDQKVGKKTRQKSGPKNSTKMST